MRYSILLLLLSAAILCAAAALVPAQVSPTHATDVLDRQLAATLREAGFTGRVEETLEKRLGRKIDRQLAELGRMLWFDTITGVNNDNACGGCHSPTRGFGDTQSIAIGIDNNGIAGPGRKGPRNQRRTPTVVNSVFFPTLMWNSRFAALSGDPFDNSQGLSFPSPEGLELSYLPHLLVAQAFIPPTERVEVAGFTVPPLPDADLAVDHANIRAEVTRRLNGIREYRDLFARSFGSVKRGGPITFDMFGQAIAEFEFTLVFANAPIDRFARGQAAAMGASEKRGALLFFGKAGCVNCHAVGGQSSEMFSDFRQHVIGVPQITPIHSNMVFDGPAANEDFGLEQVTGNPADRYAFRTSPLRNVALQPAFFHNGSFTRLDDAIRHHLGVFASARSYTWPSDLAQDLRAPTGPIEPVLERIDPLVATPIELTQQEFGDLVAFVGRGLLDERASPRKLRRLIPKRVPSGRPVMSFE